LTEDLAELIAANRHRALNVLDGGSRTAASHQGRPVVTFCSNDYLGLANHPELGSAATEATQRLGFGAGASRLVSGDLSPHRGLETALAEFVGLPDALLFPTGYQANLGVVTSLAGPDDLIVSDQANHASLIDGARLSRARIAIYRHADAVAAGAALADSTSYRRRIIVTESLFSMDGDAAPLGELARLARDHDATLVVDEAHALGALGPDGHGLCSAAGVVPDVLVGTLGKAFGAFGGFAAGPPVVREYLINRARSFIYTTAPPPSLAAAARAAVQLVAGVEGASRRALLARNIAHLESLVASLPPQVYRPHAIGPIFPIVAGADRRALKISQSLLHHGLYVPAIRPPTVPEGTARLRVTLSASHTPEQIDDLGRVLLEALA
jgi:8-amino-7-oxononanoate synthase